VFNYDLKGGAGSQQGGGADEVCMIQLVRDLGEYICSLSWGRVTELLGSEQEWSSYPDGHSRDDLRDLLHAEGRLSADEDEWARKWSFGKCPSASLGARRVWCKQVLGEAVEELGFRVLPSLSVPSTPAMSRNNSQVRT